MKLSVADEVEVQVKPLPLKLPGCKISRATEQLCLLTFTTSLTFSISISQSKIL